MFDHVKIKRTRSFKALLADFLTKRFDKRVAQNKFVMGHSNKRHKFANVIDLGHERKLIVDPVSNDASSINARVVANLDVNATENSNIIQRIVDDEEDDWSPSDQNLLQVGAIAVPFSRSGEVIDRLGAASRSAVGRAQCNRLDPATRLMSARRRSASASRSMLPTRSSNWP
jgi:hypothetical protein